MSRVVLPPLPSSVMRLSGVIASVSNLVAHVVVVIAQYIINLTQGPLFVIVTTNSVLGSSQSDKSGISCFIEMMKLLLISVLPETQFYNFHLDRNAPTVKNNQLSSPQTTLHKLLDCL